MIYLGSNEPFMSVPIGSNKITAAVWGPLDEVILTGHDNGDLCQWDIKVEKDAKLSISLIFCVHILFPLHSGW